MAVTLNHTIVSAGDKSLAATFLAEMLALEPPKQVGHFAVVEVGDTSIDFVDAEGEIQQRHLAFLVSEPEFDAIFTRIQSRQIRYWADPRRTQADAINHWDDGRGVYFDDPNGHLLEVITRPYGSGGLEAEHPHPLLAGE